MSRARAPGAPTRLATSLWRRLCQTPFTNQTLLTTAGGINTGESEEVDHAKTFRCSVMDRERQYPVGLHAKVRVGVELEQTDEYLRYDSRTYREIGRASCRERGEHWVGSG